MYFYSITTCNLSSLEEGPAGTCSYFGKLAVTFFSDCILSSFGSTPLAINSYIQSPLHTIVSCQDPYSDWFSYLREANMRKVA